MKDDGNKRKVRIGTKVSNERVKQSEHETGAQSRIQQEREAAKNVLNLNTKESRALEGRGWGCGQSDQFCQPSIFPVSFSLMTFADPIFV